MNSQRGRGISGAIIPLWMFSRAFKCPHIGPFAAVTLSPSDSGQKEATFNLEEVAECPTKPRAGHCPPFPVFPMFWDKLSGSAFLAGVPH